MKCIYLVLLSLLSFNLSAETLVKKDLIGRWEPYNEVTATTSKFVEFKSSGNVLYSHNWKTDKVFESKKLNIVDGLFIITFSKDDGSKRFKLAVSGWKSKVSGKMLIGTLYVYYKGQLTNGIPVSYWYKDEN